MTDPLFGDSWPPAASWRSRHVSGGISYTIAISLYNIGGPGTYPLGVGVSVPDGNVVVSSLAGGWRTAQTGADGTITIGGLFTVVGNNSTRSLAISLAGIPTTGVGTYALSNGSPSRTLGVTVLNGTPIAGLYNSSAAGGWIRFPLFWM